MFNTPFIIPVVAMLIPIVAIIGGIWSQAHTSRLKADQRMAMLARGIPPAEIEAILKTTAEVDNGPASKDPMSSLGRARRAAVVLISSGIGLVIFFVVLEQVLHVREVLSGAAAGLVPLAIGLGFVVDYHLQKRELSRFGLDLDANAHSR
jgi:hypothetical protein